MSIRDVNGKIIKKGDRVKAVDDLAYGFQGISVWKTGRDVINVGEKFIVDDIYNDELYLDTIPDHYGGFEPESFQVMKKQKRKHK